MPKLKQLQQVQRRARHVTDRWIIVHEPWFKRQDRFEPVLSLGDIEEIVSWLCVLFRCERRQVHAVQHQTNRRFVIAKLDLRVDLGSKLGQYSWSDFLRRPATSEHGKYSRIFEYDYVAFGDQSEKQWKEDYPASQPDGWKMKCPIVQSPPGPVWCEPPKDLNGWALPLINPAAEIAKSLEPEELVAKVEEVFEVEVKVEEEYEELEVKVEAEYGESDVKIEEYGELEVKVEAEYGELEVKIEEEYEELEVKVEAAYGESEVKIEEEYEELEVKVEAEYGESDVKIKEEYEELEVKVEDEYGESKVKVEDEYDDSELSFDKIRPKHRPIQRRIKNEEEEIDLRAMVQEHRASDVTSRSGGPLGPRKRLKLEL